LQTYEKVDCLQGLGRGSEDRLLVDLENAEPGVEILRANGTGRVADVDIGVQKRRAEFGDKLLSGIGVTAAAPGD
jgi:hypothetical protein